MKLHVSIQDEPMLHVPPYQCEPYWFGRMEDGEGGEAVEGYLKQCKMVQKYIKAYIKRHFNNGNTVIVEGMHLEPMFI